MKTYHTQDEIKAILGNELEEGMLDIMLDEESFLEFY